MAIQIDLAALSLNPNTGLLQSSYDPDAPAFADGQPYDIVGTGFGTNTGYADHIETSGIYDLAEDSNFGVVGRFDGSEYIGATIRFVVKDEGINGKCLYGYKPPFGEEGWEPNISMVYNYDVPVGLDKKIFSSRWVKHKCTGSTVGGQWKVSRHQAVNNSLSDKARESYWHMGSDSDTTLMQIRDDRGVGGDGDFSLYAAYENSPLNLDKWTRIDVLYTPPTSYAEPDTFKAEIWIYDPDGINPPYYHNMTDNQAVEHACPYRSAADLFIQHVHQNYLGNGDFDSFAHDFWVDQIYEAVGDDKRVEFCNSATWAGRTVSFIQPVPKETWTDTLIPITKVYMGTLNSGWVQVIENDASIKTEAH